ncbi:SRPBCC domain-containing protein [Herbidospora yilanensis]|uniref:SRPBCC domain-containing protein n=1 Tax=Herbidospora yilanensis TaxID=354426 RepID=UPI000782007C|nr:SRPBCC domain-containing protein [Herbidospora yilanensis]
MTSPAETNVEPIRHAVNVEADQSRTFSTFTRKLATWWPVEAIAIEPGRVRDVCLEERVGGRIYEILDDGRERDWGHILRWDPPNLVSFTWEVIQTPTLTEVELLFKPLGPALTRVEMTHKGWENLTPLLMESYLAHHSGWAFILSRFEAQVNG